MPHLLLSLLFSLGPMASVEAGGGLVGKLSRGIVSWGDKLRHSRVSDGTEEILSNMRRSTSFKGEIGKTLDTKQLRLSHGLSHEEINSLMYQAYSLGYSSSKTMYVLDASRKLKITGYESIKHMFNYMADDSSERLARKINSINSAIYKGYHKAPPINLQAVVDLFQPKVYDLDNNVTVVLNKNKFEHILERHHPDYWNGSFGNAGYQSFFDSRPTLDEIVGVIDYIMHKERDYISQMMVKINSSEEIIGKRKVVLDFSYSGVDYRMVISKKGLINQFYSK